MDRECAAIDKDKYLVFGYVKLKGNEFKLNVPTAIIDLCLQFYFLPYNEWDGWK